MGGRLLDNGEARQAAAKHDVPFRFLLATHTRKGAAYNSTKLLHFVTIAASCRHPFVVGIFG